MLNLKQLYGDRYRVTLPTYAKGEPGADQVWLQEIPGRYGHVGVWGEGVLSATTDRPNVRHRLVAVEGARVVQRGDREATVTFPPETFGAVAAVLRLRKRPVRAPLTEEQRQAFMARTAAFRFTAKTGGGAAPGATHGARDVESIEPAPRSL